VVEKPDSCSKRFCFWAERPGGVGEMGLEACPAGSVLVHLGKGPGARTGQKNAMGGRTKIGPGSPRRILATRRLLFGLARTMGNFAGRADAPVGAQVLGNARSRMAGPPPWFEHGASPPSLCASKHKGRRTREQAWAELFRGRKKFQRDGGDVARSSRWVGTDATTLDPSFRHRAS